MKRILICLTSLLCFTILMFALPSGIAERTMAATGKASGLGTPPAPQDIKIKSFDGFEIAGTFYPSFLSGRQAPAALLLHQNGGSRKEWKLFIPELQNAGYAVLAVDQRSFGETGGVLDGGATLEKDANALVGWLRQQVSIDPSEIALIGASVGSSVVIRSCALDDQCKVAIALSPGKNFFSLDTVQVVKDMTDKSFLFVAAQHDGESVDAAKTLGKEAKLDNNIMVRLYADSSRHGTALFLYPDL